MSSLIAGEDAYKAVGPPEITTSSPEHAILSGLLNLQREVVRHARGLEDIGLQTYHGADPATIFTVAIIVAAVAIVAASAALIICAETDTDPDGQLCQWSAFLLYTALATFTFGAIVSFGNLDDPDKPTGRDGPAFGLLNLGALRQLERT